MAKKAKKKVTKKDLLKFISILKMQIENLTMQVFNGDKALDLYIEMKGEKDEFIKFLEKNLEKREDDQDKKEIKEK
jgi:hypothetical protein